MQHHIQIAKANCLASSICLSDFLSQCPLKSGGVELPPVLSLSPGKTMHIQDNFEGSVSMVVCSQGQDDGTEFQNLDFGMI